MLPLILSDQKYIQTSYKYVFELSLILNDEFHLDPVNQNALFDNNNLLNDLFISFIDLIIQNTDNTKYLNKILDYLNNDDKSNAKNVLFDEKSFKKFQMNELQTKLFYQLMKLVPVEYINVKYSLVCYLLYEKVVDLKNFDLNCLNIYNRLMTHDLINNLPSSKLESWLLNMFNMIAENDNSINIIFSTQDVFEKLTKKCLYALTKEQNHENLIHLIENLFNVLQTKSQNTKLVSIIQLNLIQILDRIVKTQEICLSKENGNQSSYYLSLNEILIKLFNYFIELNNELENDSSVENHNFYLCSNLMRHLSGTNAREEQLIKYLNILLKYCLKNHKNKMKKIKKLNEEKMLVDGENEIQPDKIAINLFYVSFLKSYLVNSTKLSELIEDNSKIVDKFKIFKDLFKIYLNYNDKIFTFDRNQLISSQQQQDDLTSTTSNEYLLNLLVQSINCLSLDDFKKSMEMFDTELNDCFSNGDIKIENLIRLTNVFKFACSDFELNDQFKEDYSTFIQKVCFTILNFM